MPKGTKINSGMRNVFCSASEWIIFHTSFRTIKPSSVTTAHPVNPLISVRFDSFWSLTMSRIGFCFAFQCWHSLEQVQSEGFDNRAPLLSFLSVGAQTMKSASSRHGEQTTNCCPPTTIALATQEPLRCLVLTPAASARMAQSDTTWPHRMRGENYRGELDC